MEQWKKYKLCDFMQFNPIEKIKKGQITRKISMDLLTPFCRYAYSKNYEPYNGGAKFRNGDTIMARITPCLENGKTAYISSLDKDEAAFGSTEYIVLRNIDGVSDSLFIYYLAISQKTREIAIKSMVGSSGRQRVQQGVLENHEIVLPSLPEQKRIADILKSLDDKIELNRQINDNLEQQAQALFKSWFVDFEPFKEGKFIDSELGLIPEGWRLGTLSELGEITMGHSPIGSSYNLNADGIVFYQGRSEFGYRFPSVRLYTTKPNRYAESNSVLLSVRAPVGDINIATQKCCIGRGLASIRSKTQHHSFILYTMNVLKPLLDQYNGEGTVFGNINKKSLEQLPVIIPPADILLRFEDLVSPIDSNIMTSYQEECNLSKLRDALLPKLMSEELKINDLNS